MDTTPAEDTTPPPAHPHGRALADFGELTPAEASLLEHCAAGTKCVIGGDVPTQAQPANSVRAGLVRFFALGGDAQAPVHEQGVMLEGAWLDGKLDLNGVTNATSIDLLNCRLEEIDAYFAGIKSLNLEGSLLTQGMQGIRMQCGYLTLDRVDARKAIYLNGIAIKSDLSCIGARIAGTEGNALRCDGADISGSVTLGGPQPGDKPARPFRAYGRVDFSYARIGGNLECSGIRLMCRKDAALGCDVLNLGGSAFLRNGFRAYGEVRFLRASIGANLECTDSRFIGRVSKTTPVKTALQCEGLKLTGTAYFSGTFKARGMVDFVGANLSSDLNCVGGNFSNPRGDALWAQRMRLAGGLKLEQARFEGQLDLTSAEVGELEDGRPRSWNAGKQNLVLDGFTYTRIGKDATSLASERIAWLQMQIPAHLKDEFRPQPWDQLIATLRAGGHPNEARDVAIEKERAGRRAGKIKLSGVALLHDVYGLFAAYGFKPWQVWRPAFFVWALGTILFAIAARPEAFLTCAGDEDPRLILPSDYKPEPQAASPRQRQLQQDEAIAKLGFFAPIYSLDVLLPAISLGEKSKWQTVIAERPGWLFWFSWFLRAFTWLEIAFGWITALMLTPWLATLVKN